MFELLGYFVMGWILYRLVSAWVAIQEIKQAVSEAVERKVITDEIARQVMIVRMEPVEQGDYHVVLAYNSNTNKFLGQASTQSEAEEMLKSKYPNTNLVIVSEKITTNNSHPIDAKSI